MNRLERLKAEVNAPVSDYVDLRSTLMFRGYAENLDQPVPVARGFAAASLFADCPVHVYDNDLIVGSIRGKHQKYPDYSQEDAEYKKRLVDSYGFNHFTTNFDHYTPDYETFLHEGISGTIAKIKKAQNAFAVKPEHQDNSDFLEGCLAAMNGFMAMVENYGKAAGEKAQVLGDQEFLKISDICKKLTVGAPQTFREALQLLWFAHTAFVLEGRYAMALGRMDQYLLPFYCADIRLGILTKAEALQYLEHTLYKIGEKRMQGADDVVNIAIGGVKRDGTGGVNGLSYLILEAVKNCNIPGPNLSARIYKGIPDEFIDACLQVIGTGLGYPALMNDEVNIPALYRHGYSMEDCRDYSMVGCIENFISGKQPTWSDGRYNSPKYVELALNSGRCMLTNTQMGPPTKQAEEIFSMDEFMENLVLQMEYGAADYMARFRNENDRYNKLTYSQPFLSCFCACCIERGLDINNGGAMYPSAHGAGCMGIATVSDSLAAIEKVVFTDKHISLADLRDALAADFCGHEELRIKLQKAPKYGNNDELVDKYAVWFVDIHEKIFSKYKTRDGGAIYTAIASNVSNIPAGLLVGATPDGRHSRKPVSEAASPSHGADLSGPTSVVLSTTKPDYTKVSCGTVLNQKYSPSVFKNQEKRARLLALIKVYFDKGGQEMQINAVSRDILRAAMKDPQQYKNLVVRVSGFSAYYVHLTPQEQLDILERTEHE